MVIQATRHKGVTPPISLTLPTDAELVANDALINELKKQNNFEGSEETERRYGSRLLLSFRLADTATQKENAAVHSESHDGVCKVCEQETWSTSVNN